MIFLQARQIYLRVARMSRRPPLHPRTGFLGERPEISIVVGVFVSKQSGNLSVERQRDSEQQTVSMQRKQLLRGRERDGEGEGRGEREGVQLVGGCGLEGVQFEVLTV